ncbi:hypothetical protein AK812_SmicGene45285, partial [Symbiodinium microadriaticum]
ALQDGNEEEPAGRKRPAGKATKAKRKTKKEEEELPEAPEYNPLDKAEKNRPAADRRTPAGRKGLDEVTAKPEVRKPSVMPVQAPKFKANSWEAEVGELVDQISLAVRTTLLPVLPTARVDGYVTANPMG